MTELVDRYRVLATEELAAAYRDLGGLERAIAAPRLAILAVLDEREVYRPDGCLDAAQWVSATDLVGSAAARSEVAVARALPKLPAIASVVEAGGLSFDQLAPLVVFADAASDERWAKDAPGMSPAQLEALARERHRVTREEAEHQDRRRSFRWWKDRRGLGVRFAGLLPDAAAAVVTERVTALGRRHGPRRPGRLRAVRVALRRRAGGSRVRLLRRGRGARGDRHRARRRGEAGPDARRRDPGVPRRDPPPGL